MKKKSATRLGVCASAIGSAAVLAASTADFVEENVQSFLLPRDGDEAAFKERLKSARACGKPILAANCFLPGDLKCVGPVIDRRAIRVYAETAFRRAALAGIGLIVFGSGGARAIPEGFDRAQARAQFIDLLRELAPIAAASKVSLVVEPLNRGECNFVNSVDEGGAIVREVAHPAIRLLADIYHMLRDNEAPEAIGRNLSLLAHIHVAEREKRTAPGVAGDDLRPYLRELAGYAGAVSIECGWQNLAAQLPSALGELRRQLDAARA